MADIAKCDGMDCKKRENCFRFTSPSDLIQTYLVNNKPDNCGFFWSNNKQTEDK